jgi:hypothetical protein
MSRSTTSKPRWAALLALAAATTRAARTRWRTMFLLTGGPLTVIGIALPSGAALVPGILILLLALLTQTEAPDCQAAAHLAAWHWSG